MKVATREGFSEGLLELGRTNDSIVVLDADLSSSTRTARFGKEFPDRFFNVGIAEQDLMCQAAGLAIAGKIPFASTFAIFASGRAFDQIRNTICYSNLNVKVCGGHGGLTVSDDGASHQALEELALMRAIPNMTVIIPCDSIEAKKATIAAGIMNGPVYLRLGREPLPIITNEDTPFEIGKGIVLKEGSDITLATTGSVVPLVMEAQKELAKKGIDAEVLHMHTIKPLDYDLLKKSLSKTGALVSVEEYHLYCGFGSALCEYLVQDFTIPVEFVSLGDHFGESGKMEQLLEKFGITVENIIKKTEKALSRKK